jgi:hypothetical protein
MTKEDCAKDPPPFTVDIAVADDKRSAMLRFKHDENVLCITAADTASVEALIATLGQTRSQMLEPVPMNLAEGILPLAAYDPRWHILPDTENKFATFWIRHPGLGWSGYGFPRHEAGNIARWLRKIVPISSTRDTLSPSATSFGGDTFLITTEGLGFYYYGKGERRIGPNPFEQIEYDSDRAAGIVAGSIAERRLEEALRSRMRRNQTAISQNLFRPSGALGPFSTKIDLAYLLRLLSHDAWKDLTNLKNVRNDFAHDLELDSFEAPSIKDRCKNFLLVDRHIGPIPPPSDIGIDAAIGPAGGRPDPYLGIANHEHRLSDPRFRYTMTAQLVSYRLGEGAEREDATLPLM